MMLPVWIYSMEENGKPKGENQSNRRETFIKIPSKEKLYQDLKCIAIVAIHPRLFLLRKESDNPDIYERRYNKKSAQEQKSN